MLLKAHIKYSKYVSFKILRKTHTEILKFQHKLQGINKGLHILHFFIKQYVH